jgi:hypothetical protein
MSYEILSNLARKGGFTLPAELIEAVENRARHFAAVSELRHSLPAYDGSQRALIDADKIRAAENAADAADNKVRNWMRSNHDDTLVLEHLRPAFQAVIDAVRKLPADTPTTADAAVRVKDGASQFLALEKLAARYRAILDAAQLLYGLGGHDSAARMFADSTAGPDRTSNQYQYNQPRGPKEPLARLLWLAHGEDAQPYLPTNRERDKASAEFHRHQ